MTSTIVMEVDDHDATSVVCETTITTSSEVDMLYATSGPPCCDNVTLPEGIQELLPPLVPYHVCKLVEEPSSNSEEARFTATFRLPFRKEGEFLKWLGDFQTASYTTWRVKRTFPRSGKFMQFKKSYRCQHNTRSVIENTSTDSNRRVHSKNTNCDANMMVSIKTVHKHSRSKDIHLPQYPTEVVLRYTHNHTVFCADALKFRDVSEEASESLKSLFKRKYGPAAAVEMLKYELQMKHGYDYPIYAADRSICPDLQYAYRLYRKVLKKDYGEASGEEMVAILQDYTNQYNAKMGSTCMATRFQDNQLAVAICTPLMQRVHKHLKHAGEMVFMDASSNLDRHGCKVFLLLTHSCVGGLPLGVLITASESEATVTAALKLYLSILPEQCFSGRGRQGPKIFMTDDRTAEHNSIRWTFPNATCLLSAFHVLQATWRWLWDNKNQIPKNDRPNHLVHLERILYANTSAEMDIFYRDSLQDQTLSEKFKKYLSGYMDKKKMWALSLQGDVLTRGNNTNNFAEVAMQVLKDKILQGTKSFSAPQLADFMCTLLEQHYHQRLLDVANGGLDYVVAPQYMPVDKDVTKDDIQQISSTEFEVESHKGVSHHVNTKVGHCTCNVGKTGGACKHQGAVMKFYEESSTNLVPTIDPEMRQVLHQIATDYSENSTAQDLRHVFEDMIQKLQKEPQLMEPAFKAFIHHYKQIKTSRRRCSALRNFGKNHSAAGTSESATKSKRRSIKRRSRSKKIGV